jgi:hypothetical protein
MEEDSCRFRDRRDELIVGALLEVVGSNGWWVWLDSHAIRARMPRR